MDNKSQKMQLLHKVYSAVTPDETRKLYAQWSSDYDQDLQSYGYCLPKYCCEILFKYAKEHLNNVKIWRLLDFGAGTGLVARECKELMINQNMSLTAMDLSKEMLQIAKNSSLYDRYIADYWDSSTACRQRMHTWLQDELPFHLIVSVGTFTDGHVPCNALLDLVRLLAPGGLISFTVSNAYYEKTRSDWDKILHQIYNEQKCKLLDLRENVLISQADERTARIYCLLKAQ
ncbi:hypothetical protein MP228_009039 [Amoeboaphelidium protococcarum]|nr:hypothetical protein MP228_009039 [Amoeboaphelidium protococcarum]